jgi:hypothetical protein
LLFIALFVGHVCGSIAESRGKDRKTWFRRGTIFSFLAIWGLHQRYEYERFKGMGVPLKDLLRASLAERK